MALDRHMDEQSEGTVTPRSDSRAFKLAVRPGTPIQAVGRRYSRFVGIMKIALPLAAICLMATIAAWPALMDQSQPMVEALEKQPDILQVTAPVLVGMDQDERPYSIAADRANQAPESPHIVELSRPEAEISLLDGTRISLKAALGTFDRDSKQLHLMGDVRLWSDDGHRFSTDAAFVDMDRQSAWGDRPVRGDGPTGQIEAEGFRIEGSGATVVFTGQSRATLLGSATQPRQISRPAASPIEIAPPVRGWNDEN